MEKVDIPRLALETFAQINFKVPFLAVEQYPLHANYFSIKNRNDNPVNDYISPNRRQFFKIFHITSGKGILTVGLHQYFLNAGDIAFLRPDEIMSWQIVQHYPYFKPSKAVIQLTESQSAKVNSYFEFILEEEEGLISTGFRDILKVC